MREGRKQWDREIPGTKICEYNIVPRRDVIHKYKWKEMGEGWIESCLQN